MKIDRIEYCENFGWQFEKLPKVIQKKVKSILERFQNNPFHPSLRLHKLKGKLDGLWSISVNRKTRMIFEALEDDTILLVSIGTHAIYSD